MAEAEAEAEEEMRGKVCFVTVGTTLFDGLIRAVDETRVLRRLRSMGYSRVVMQIGRGSYEPDTRVSREDDCAISIEHYRFKPGLAADMEEADLIISHAGAGSIMEALRLRKPLVVVVNEELMDNHQTELADALSSRGHLVSALPDSLYDALSDPCLENPKPWHEPKPEVFAWVCNELMSQQSS